MSSLTVNILAVIVLFIGLIHSENIVRDNIVFTKVNEVSTTRARWLATIVIDFDEIEQFLSLIMRDARRARYLLEQSISTYMHKPEFSPFLNALRSLLTEVNYLDTVRSDIRKEIRQLSRINARDKRSLLPFVGDALSWLFGTVSESDLRGIRSQISKLAKNQESIVHVVEQSLSLMNESRELIRENRHAVNNIMVTLRSLDSKLVSITEELQKSIIENRHFIEILTKIDLFVGEINILLRDARFYLTTLRAQLDYLSLGKISTRVISPSKLLTLLTQIEKAAPKLTSLIADPRKNIWEFYRRLTSDTVFIDGKIMIVLSIPMIRLGETFEVYQVLPVPMISPQYIRTSQSNDNTDLLAVYDLEASGFLIDKARQTYMLLSDVELETCSHGNAKYCNVNSAKYSVMTSTTCLISLFTSKQSSKFCEARVSKKHLPIAHHLMNDNWVIISRVGLQFSLVCNGRHSEINIKPPLDIIRVENECVASNKYFLLSTPYIAGRSTMSKDKSFDLKPTHFSQSNVWEPLNNSFPNLTEIQIPDALPEIKDLPISKFIYELQKRKNVNVQDKPTRGLWFYLSLGIALVVVISIFIQCCKTKVLKFCNNINCLPICLRKGKAGMHKGTDQQDVELREMGCDGNKPPVVSASSGESAGSFRERIYPYLFMSGEGTPSTLAEG